MKSGSKSALATLTLTLINYNHPEKEFVSSSRLRPGTYLNSHLVIPVQTTRDPFAYEHGSSDRTA